MVINSTNHQQIKNELYPKFPNIIYAIQNTALGTADAVKCALPYINSDVLIINGDTPLLQHTLLQKIINQYNNNLLITMTDTLNNKDNGRIVVIDNHIQIIEEKDCTNLQKQITLINCGIYMINIQLLQQIIPKITNNNNNNEYYLTDLTKFVKSYAYVVSSDDQYQLYNVNTSEQLEFINKIIYKNL